MGPRIRVSEDVEDGRNGKRRGIMRSSGRGG
jgi:hypothetical protein